jgi:hypothetical protein
MERETDAAGSGASFGTDGQRPPGGSSTLQNTRPHQPAPSTKLGQAKWSIVAALVVFLVIGVFGYVTFKPTAAAPKPVSGIGTAQVVDFGDGTAHVTIATLVTVKPGQFYTAKGTLVGYTVTVKALSGIVNPSPLRFTARTEAGQSLDSLTGAAADQLPYGELKAGEKRRGVIAFDVHASNTISAVVMLGCDMDPAATWIAN